MLLGAALGALAPLALGAPLARYKVSEIDSDTLLVRVDQWTGATWVCPVDDAADRKGSWARVVEP